jgi:hypothetical protein
LQLQSLLKKEYETLDLIKTLYYDRLAVKEGEDEEDQQPTQSHDDDDMSKFDQNNPRPSTTRIPFHLEDAQRASSVYRKDKELQEVNHFLNLSTKPSIHCRNSTHIYYILATQMRTILAWLELNHSRGSDPDVTARDIAWEHTLDSLKVITLRAH